MKPLISVIIPAFNCETTLEEAVTSIREQTYVPLEILIVDDGSTDRTLDIAKRMAGEDARIRVYKTPSTDGNRFSARLNRNVNAGYAARNEGFRHAQGEYITFQDADDASMLNRIEVQYALLQEYSATHLSIDWVKYDPDLVGKKFNATQYLQNHPDRIVGPEEIYRLSQKTKGLVSKLSPRINTFIPFRIKRMRILHRLFFGSLESYPGTGNSPLFHRSVIGKIIFRPLTTRVWPSFMGRGADRDFNFQVAETFRNSYTFHIPIYLWRVPTANSRYETRPLSPYIL